MFNYIGCAFFIVSLILILETLYLINLVTKTTKRSNVSKGNCIATENAEEDIKDECDEDDDEYLEDEEEINVIVLRKEFLPARKILSTQIISEGERCKPCGHTEEKEKEYRIYYKYDGEEIFCFVDEDTYECIKEGASIKIFIEREFDEYDELTDEYHTIMKRDET